ncbi:deoxyguanosinetriphosphate triphosphohydrolase family protein [Bosea psychrotolerans]|uniref:dGTPase n=1 Tax=Bosea psychrotolerans TaxID=1871628 RepID=A0A2S4M5P3_9HYPH|nr:dNTP triphosphohydrolase [Bosea psychrotolerans]POR50012.1 dGTPase [Bosea psychrotolerans]
MADDQRNPAQRDADRILYSSAFRRLAGITQIVRAGEADVFHTRQQHTFKVAQIGRRLAEKCYKANQKLAAAIGFIPDVVEAACLAHDLGHPPFGHRGEYALNDLVEQAGDPDGYEGNAQTFRIITKLAVRFEECVGLDLTRATLAATLKYPWMRDKSIPARSTKWNAYRAEADDFAFARQGLDHNAKTPEADLMDWADDIAYSVHDLEDFHRCGLIPWRRILPKGDQSDQIIQRAAAKWFDAPPDATGRLREAMRSLNDFIEGSFGSIINEPYVGARNQRQELRNLTSGLIGRYIRAAELREPDAEGKCLHIEPDASDQVLVLKQITRDYIISNPSLAAQQKGQERIIRELFEDLLSDTKSGSPPNYLPQRLSYLYEFDSTPARIVSDCIASLTEGEAVALHARLRGVASGSVLDPIVR